MTFTGFGRGTSAFFTDLAANNSREWWHANRARYDAQLVVPEETTEEIGVLKGIATTYVITVRDAQPIYDNQQEVLSILVGALMDSDGRHLSAAFAADWHDLGDGPGTEAARLRRFVDQIASLTDLSAVSLHDRIRGTHWRVGDKPLW